MRESHTWSTPTGLGRVRKGDEISSDTTQVSWTKVQTREEPDTRPVPD